MMFDTTIGLEIHIQLKTKSKLFSGSATAFGQHPNSQTSYIDAALPGTLPVLNHKAVALAIRFGLAIHATINQHSVFERKNYFYPDLPKGYQISQFQFPIVSNGHLDLDINGIHKRIEIVRAHLEEDAGKSVHEKHHDMTAIDLNRAGTPLLEIVTAPCFSDATEVVVFLKQLHQMVRFLDVCDGNMQEGSFRVDVNVSLKPHGSKTLGVRAEIKNINSFKFIEEAIHYETLRQQSILEKGLHVIQETRLYCPDSQKTFSMRSKENENDYRYFPDPDLLPVEISSDDIEYERQNMPLLPSDIELFCDKQTDFNDEDKQFLCKAPEHWLYFKAALDSGKAKAKTIVNWMKGPYLNALNERGLDFNQALIEPPRLVELLGLIDNKTLSSTQAKTVFQYMLNGDRDIQAIISREGMSAGNEVSSELLGFIADAISNHPSQVAEYKAGKDKLLAFFVGQVMKASKGKADPALISELLQKELK